jgi:ComF family protein
VTARGATIARRASSLFSCALDFVYPRACRGCGDTVPDAGTYLCWDCLAGVPTITMPYCSRCGDPAEGQIEHQYVCALCRRFDPPFDLARSAVRYRGIIRNVLHGFKYGDDVCVTNDLVNMLEACTRTHFSRLRFDAVVGVPLYARRERERTYNQSRLLAGGLARRLRAPLATTRCIVRRRETASQTGLNADRRRANVRGAFTARDADWLQGRTILLVDDVMTTGATVAECAGTIKDAGAAGVYVVTVARG